MSRQLDEALPRLAWRVTKTADGAMAWTTEGAQGETLTSSVEPNSTLPLRLLVRAMGWLPIEWLL
jgi:putative cardiolipin synthase